MQTPTNRRATSADLEAIVGLLADDVLGSTRENPGPPVAKRMNIDIEPGFTGVDAEVDFRLSAWFGQLLALHAGLAPHHLFRTGAKDGRTKLSHGSGPGLHGPARLILGWVATHPRISPILSRSGPHATCQGCEVLVRERQSVV